MDYEIIAGTIHKVRQAHPETQDREEGWLIVGIDLVQDALEEALKADNPRFDEKRFREACR